MISASFAFGFTTTKDKNDVFEFLREPRNWWIGFYHEIIEGSSRSLDDEFTFRAGDGMHYSKQRLIEYVEGHKITWLVIDSHLSFLKAPTEWNGTRIQFELEAQGDMIEVRFTHEGLTPHIECYGECSNAWSLYLAKLKERLG